MLFVTSDYFFHCVGCDIILVCVFLNFNCIFSHLIIVFCFCFLFFNESICITTGDEPGNAYGGGYKKHTACIYCTFVIWVCFSCFSIIARIPKSCEFYSQTLYCQPEL